MASHVHSWQHELNRTEPNGVEMKESFIILAGFFFGLLVFIIGLNIVIMTDSRREWSQFQFDLALVLTCVLTVVVMFGPTIFVVLNGSPTP